MGFNLQAPQCEYALANQGRAPGRARPPQASATAQDADQPAQAAKAQVRSQAAAL